MPDGSTIRIALDVTPASLGGGGVATYTTRLASHLRTFPNISLLEIDHRPTRAARGVRRLDSGVAREAHWHPLGAARAARRHAADLIHTPAAMPLHGRGLPVVMTIHDAIPWRHPEWFTKANALQQRLLVGPAARRAARVLTDSQASRSDIIEFLAVDPDRVEIIPLGVDEAFDPIHRDPDWLARSFGTGPGPVVLSVGTPEPRKNLAGTLAAFERVLIDIPEATLLLVGGGGWGADAISARAARLGPRVVRTGHVAAPDLPRIYASADCFLFPSLFEGFGLPPLEAMASGLPVVCSNRPSLPEVVDTAALTAEPSDIEGLAGAVLAALGDHSLREDLQQKGKARAARFTWQRTAAATISAYRRALM